jgi:hypothetical protein
MSAPQWIDRIQSLLAVATRAQASLLQAAEQLPGFQFDETMTGRVALHGANLPPGERGIKLHLHAAAPRLADYLRDGRTDLHGTLSIDDLVDGAALSGGLWIWPQRRVIRYELSFLIGTQRYQLAGQKDIRLLDFSRTMTTLPALIYDHSGDAVGSASVVFDWADLPAFLGSFRLRHRSAADGLA